MSLIKHFPSSSARDWLRVTLKREVGSHASNRLGVGYVPNNG